MDILSKKYYDPYSETMEDDYFPSLGRPSVIANEDDYDYALELVPDQEYRLVAKTLSELIGFDEIDTSEIEDNRIPPAPPGHGDSDNADEHELRLSIGPEVPDASISARNSLDDMSNDQPLASASSDSLHSKDSSISYQEFLWKMGMMQKQKTWIESVRRRSSLNFQSQFMLSDKVARDKFLLMMCSGVHVRRHQSNHISEMIRLYSVNGSKTVEWTKPRPLDLLRQRQRNGQFLDGSTDAIYTASHDREAFDCCITICGCGDDLLIENDTSPHRRSRSPQKSGNASTSNVLAEVDENRYQGMGRCCHNLGFKRNGFFEDTDIVTIHPATKEDPTHPGMTGTESLRSSKDSYNAMLSFSIVYRRMLSSQGYETLDLECDNEETYFILLRGFYMLREEAEERRKALLLEYQKSQANRKRGLAWLWDAIKSRCFAPAEELATDPISVLYDSRDDKGMFSVFLSAPKRTDIETMYPKQQQWLEGKRVELPPAQFLGWNTAGTQIWARLAMAGLDVKPVYSWDLTRILLKIRCPQWRLEEVAENMHLRLKNRDGTMRRFKVSRRDTFVSLGTDGTIFRSSERQQIIDFIIRSKIKDGGAELDENSSLGRKISQRFPLHMESRLRDLRHKWIKFWKIEPPGHVSLPWSPLTTPISESLSKIVTTLKMVWYGLLRQPLDHVAEYFGEDIAFYFAFNAFYTRWLVVPSLLGFIVFCFQIHDQRLDHWLCLPYAITVMIWACFLLAYWRQKSSVFAYRWGVLDYEIEEKERPQFQAPYEYDDSTGEVHKVYPQWKRILKYSITIPFIVVISVTMLVIMATVFSTQDQLYYNYAHRESLNYHPKFNIFIGVSTYNEPEAIAISSAPNSTTTIVAAQIGQLRDPWGTHITTEDLGNADFWVVTFFYPCLYGILVDITALLFSSVAVYLNDYENHRTSTIYTNRLILKVFSFQFITVFTSLYYYAFISQKGETSYLRMSVTIFALMTVGQWYSAILDIFIPAIYHRTQKFHRRMSIAKINRRVYQAREYLDRAIGWLGLRRASSAAKLSPQQQQAHIQVEKRAKLLAQARSRVWEEALMLRYSTFDDYTNLILQLGFVLLFSIVFPLAPLILLLNNLGLIRLKALKICYFRQRPLATKVSGMGVWEDLLQVMSAAGILTNCGIMVFTSSVLSSSEIGRRLDYGGLILLLFGFEHVLLLFKYWLHVSIPRVPPAVLRAKNRDRQSAAGNTGNHGNDNGDKSKTKKKPKSRLSSNIFPILRESTMPEIDRDEGILTSIPFQGLSSNELIDDQESRRTSLTSMFAGDVFSNEEDNILYSKDMERSSEKYDPNHMHFHLGEGNDQHTQVRFSTVGDDIQMLSPAASDSSSSSSEREGPIHGPGVRGSYPILRPSFEPTNFREDDDESLSSAESAYDSDAHHRQQQLWGEQAAYELQREEEDAWNAYVQQRQQLLQQRMQDLQRRQEELTHISRSRTPSPKRLPAREASPRPSVSLLQTIVDTVWGNSEKRQSALSLGPLNPNSRSTTPPQSSLTVPSLSKKKNVAESTTSDDPQPTILQRPIQTIHRHDASSSQVQEQRVGGNISINSDIYRQAQVQQASRKKTPTKSNESSATSTQPPLRRPSPVLAENDSRLANLPKVSGSLVETSQLRLRSALKTPTSTEKKKYSHHPVNSTGPNYNPAAFRSPEGKVRSSTLHSPPISGQTSLHPDSSVAISAPTTVPAYIGANINPALLPDVSKKSPSTVGKTTSQPSKKHH